MRKYLVLSLLTFLVLFSAFPLSNAQSFDSQEESFAVTPLPFWDTSGNTSIDFENQLVEYDYEYNEGNRFGNLNGSSINSGTLSNTFLKDGNKATKSGSDTIMARHYIFFETDLTSGDNISIQIKSDGTKDDSGSFVISVSKSTYQNDTNILESFGSTTSYSTDEIYSFQVDDYLLENDANFYIVFTIYLDVFASESYTHNIDYCVIGDLVGHWRFEEGSGSTAYDSSGQENDGTITGATYQDGKIEEYSLEFDGDGDYVTISHDASLHSSSISFGLWLNINQFPMTDETFPISKGLEYSLVVDETGDWGYLLYSSGGGHRYDPTVGSALQTDTWFHLFITYDGSDVVGYKDGEEDFTVSLDAGLNDAGNNLWFGYRGQTPTSQEDFNGTIDEVQIYSSALSESEISELYEYQKTFGDFDVEVPMKKYKNHKFETMFDVSNINDSVVQIGVENFIISFNQTTVWHNSEYYPIDFIVRFKFELKYSINEYTCVVRDNQSTKIAEYFSYMSVPKNTDTFMIYSESFYGLMYQYYATGTVDYGSTWNQELIEDDSDTTYSYNQFTTESTVSSGTFEYKSSLFVSGFQFYRAELNPYWYLTGLTAGDTTDFDFSAIFEFFDESGDIKYTINTTLQFTYSSQYRDFIVYDSEGNKIAENYYAGSRVSTVQAESEFTAQIAVWRTQENNLAVKMKDDLGATDKFGYWFSNETLKNFQCNITYHYAVEWGGLTSIYINGGFDYEEISYNNLEGVAEPHFSSTWWEGIPIISHIINGFIFLGNLLAGGLTALGSVILGGLGAIFSPFFTALQDAVNAIAGGVWDLFTSVLDTIHSAITDIASSVWGFFEGVIDSIYDGVQDIIAGIVEWIEEGINNILIPTILSGIQSLIEAIIDVLTAIVNYVGNWFGIADLADVLISLADNFVTSASAFVQLSAQMIIFIAFLISYIIQLVEYALPWILGLGGLYVIFDLVDPLIENDLDTFQQRSQKYMSGISWVGEQLFNAVNMIIQFIGGIIP